MAKTTGRGWTEDKAEAAAIAHELTESVSDERGQEQGVWIYLKPGYAIEVQEHTIHEDNWRRAFKRLRNEAMPCDCAECDAHWRKRTEKKLIETAACALENLVDARADLRYRTDCGENTFGETVVVSAEKIADAAFWSFDANESGYFDAYDYGVLTDYVDMHDLDVLAAKAREAINFAVAKLLAMPEADRYFALGKLGGDRSKQKYTKRGVARYVTDEELLIPLPSEVFYEGANVLVPFEGKLCKGIIARDDAEHGCLVDVHASGDVIRYQRARIYAYNTALIGRDAPVEATPVESSRCCRCQEEFYPGRINGNGECVECAILAEPVEATPVEATPVIPVPFTSKAHDDQTADLSGCVLCGRSTPSPRFFVEIADGGKIVNPGSADKEDAGYMGMYPIGSECKNKLPSDYIVKE